jgi:hypothetical protein
VIMQIRIRTSSGSHTQQQQQRRMLRSCCLSSVQIKLQNLPQLSRLLTMNHCTDPTKVPDEQSHVIPATAGFKHCTEHQAIENADYRKQRTIRSWLSATASKKRQSRIHHPCMNRRATSQGAKRSCSASSWDKPLLMPNFPVHWML